MPRGLLQLGRWLRWRWRHFWTAGHAYDATTPPPAPSLTSGGSQFDAGRVWTEREYGDWEACVACSYEMALLYAGVQMAAPYTQAEREKIEAHADEPQNLATTDYQANRVYGAQLRGPSTSDPVAFVNRPGVGFCITGVGSPLGYQPGTFTHEVFGIGQSGGQVAIYDPLAPEGYGPSMMSVSAVADWILYLGPGDAREITAGELGGEMNPITQIPIATGRGFGPASIYGNEQRSVKLFDLAQGAEMDPVGVYSWPATPTDSAGKVSLAAIRVDLIGAGGEDLRVGYLGIDRLELHEAPTPEPPTEGDYAEGFADGQAQQQAVWTGWLEARPVGEVEQWADQAPTESPPARTR
jgi:hypothetical protein